MSNHRRKPQAPPLQAILTPAQLNGMLPLDWMLSVMRDPTAAETRRDRMAVCAAQYVHARAADTRKTKKAHQAEAAKKAGAGTAWDADLEYGGERPRQ